MPIGTKAVHKMRMSMRDAYYAGDLVSGARILAIFGELATELCIIEGGEEGLFRAYKDVEFLAPAYVGDFIEAEAEIIVVGKTSRTMRFVARKVIESLRDPKNPERARILKKPIVMAKACGTCVIPSLKKRGR